jgi:hypothetical protein
VRDLAGEEPSAEDPRAQILRKSSACQNRIHSRGRFGRLTLQHRVDHLKSLVDLLANFGTSQDNLAADEDEEHNLWLDHAVNETREQLRLVGTEVVMLGRKTFEADGELDVARSDNVLDLEIGELGVEAELLDDAGVLARGKLRVILRLGASDNHLAAREDKCGGLRLTNTHDDSRETLRVVLSCGQTWPANARSKELVTYLSISSMKGDGLEIQTAIEIDRSHDVPD